MPTREILNSHTAPTLRKEISKTNIKGYSTMKKEQLIDVMMKHADRFHHIKMRDVGFPIKALFEGKKEAPPKKEKKVIATKSKTGIFKMKPEFSEKDVKDMLKKESAKKAPAKKAPAKKAPAKKAPVEKKKKQTQAQIINDVTSLVEYTLQDELEKMMLKQADIKFPTKEGKVKEIFKWQEKYDKEQRKTIKNNIKKAIEEKDEKLDDAQDFELFVLDRKKWKTLID